MKTSEKTFDEFEELVLELAMARIIFAEEEEEEEEEEARIVVSMKDITERKQIVDALAKSEALLREAQGVAHIGHWELDTSIMTPAWSEEIFHIFGLDPEEDEPSFEAHQKVTHPDDWGILNNAVTTSMAEGIRFDIEFRILRPDKTIRWIHAIGYPKKDREDRIVSVFGTAQDITDRKLVEDALRGSEERYRNLFENANEAIFVAQDGNLVFLNPMTPVLIGYSGEELVSRPFIEFIHPDDRDMVIDRHVRRMKGEEFPHRYSFRIIHRDGNVRWVELNAVLINWKGKAATLNFLNDITQRREMVEAIRQSEERYRTIIVTAQVVF